MEAAELRIDLGQLAILWAEGRGAQHSGPPSQVTRLSTHELLPAATTCPRFIEIERHNSDAFATRLINYPKELRDSNENQPLRQNRL